MKKIFRYLLATTLIFALIGAVSIKGNTIPENWELTAPSGINFVCGGSHYLHTLNTVTNINGGLTGTGWYDPDHSYTWDMTGTIDGDDIDITITYTGTSAGAVYELSGEIASDGSISGTVDSNCQAFTMSAGSAVFNRRAEITAPDEGENVYGDVTFSAYLVDNDQDSVQWAIRPGTCASGASNVWGNVGGHNDLYTWLYDGVYTQNFTTSVDTSGWPGGMYCFVFNPREQASDVPIRLTREFYVADALVHGGGQVIQAQGDKPKDDYKISFGGWLWDLGSGNYSGDWEINFHNVGNDTLDKTKFRTTQITAMNFHTGNDITCNDAMNFTALGEWNGIPGYKLIFRAGDFGSPNTLDTVRIELRDPSNGFVYDTYPTEFSKDSSCIGTARTLLDKGNITIWQD